MSAARALLDRLVDYAGLFPPAALDLSSAANNYASYLSGPDAWMLGRFVIPAARLAELSAWFHASDESSRPLWHVSALLSADPASDARAVEQFHVSSAARAIVDMVEAKADSPAAVQRIAAAAPPGAALFVELAPDDRLEACIDALARAGAGAKLRTGGTVAEAFPPPDAVVHFTAACIAANVPFKFTAGLHHPLRAAYRLTYAADAASAPMFGYLNVFLTAALLRATRDRVEARALLLDGDPESFEISNDRVAWRGHTFGAADIAATRGLARSFGSCSFCEPVDELRQLRPRQ